MKIIAHRGLWRQPEEKNCPKSFRAAAEKKFGIETDVRDLDGELVISHDIPRAGVQTFDDFLTQLTEMPVTLALNIKSDGLSQLLKDKMAEYTGQWYVFDMSIPDLRQHLNAGNNVYTRISEVEDSLPWRNEVRGVWMDSFSNDWQSANSVRKYLELGLEVCVVSSELHGRDHKELWDNLKPLANEEAVSICTDFPNEADKFFNQP